MDSNNFSEIMYKIIRPVLIYGCVFLTSYILSKFEVNFHLISFFAVNTGIILEKIFKQRTKV